MWFYEFASWAASRHLMEQTREKRPERTQTSAQNEFNEFGNGMRTIWTTSADTNCREQYKEYKDKLRVRKDEYAEWKDVCGNTLNTNECGWTCWNAGPGDKTRSRSEASKELLCQTSQDLPVAFISNARHLEILNPCRQMTDQGQTLSEAGQYCHGSHL